mmetsp:Transcript_106238/g.310572  ORF Transcript_106238/g.310572 Transcript_106238/m.310572 type:complete len:257 (+) Transcript_106238:458-1228(+)
MEPQTVWLTSLEGTLTKSIHGAPQFLNLRLHEEENVKDAVDVNVINFLHDDLPQVHDVLDGGGVRAAELQHRLHELAKGDRAAEEDQVGQVNQPHHVHTNVLDCAHGLGAGHEEVEVLAPDDCLLVEGLVHPAVVAHSSEHCKQPRPHKLHVHLLVLDGGHHADDLHDDAHDHVHEREEGQQYVDAHEDGVGCMFLARRRDDLGEVRQRAVHEQRVGGVRDVAEVLHAQVRAVGQLPHAHGKDVDDAGQEEQCERH